MSKKFVDLTFPIEEGMTTFPVHWHPFVEITQLGRHGIENRETRKIVLGTHTGTHCDAPSHFIPGGETVDSIPPERFIGPALLLDCSDLDDLHEIGQDELKERMGQHRPERLIIRYDWSRHFGAMKYYSDIPFLSEEAAQWLVEIGVRLVGMDTPMPDNPKHGWGCDVDSPIHKILLGNGVVLVEYMTNLDQVPPGIFELIVLPLKVLNGDGAPVRCIAVLQ